MPKWKMLAASAASALPPGTVAEDSTKCAAEPAPPLAMTGICTASQTRAVSSQSKPVAHAVGVHAGQQDFARAALLGLAGPVDDACRPVGLRPPET